MGNRKRHISRRRFLLGAGTALPFALGVALWPRWAFSSLPFGLQRSRWYEVVQDMKNPGKWHISLFAAPSRGDLAKATRLSYRVAKGSSLASVREQLEYPARFQFRGGGKEQTF